MKGKEINTLCKTMVAFDQTHIPMADEVRVINEDHVMICAAERVNGAPLFDVNDDRCIDVKSVIKLNAKEDYTISKTDKALVFSNDTSNYSFIAVHNSFEPVKEYRFTPSLIIDDVSAKELLAAVKDGKKFADWVRLTVHDWKFTVSNETDGHTFSKELHWAWGEPFDSEKMQNTYSSMFTTEYLIKVLSCVPAKTKLVIGLDNDYPIKIAWNTEQYRYGVLIAPRIVNN